MRKQNKVKQHSPSRLPARSFFGEMVQERQINGFHLNVSRYQPSSRIAAHSHENAYFCLVRSGRFAETCTRQTSDCAAGTLIFHPAGDVHLDQFHSVKSELFNVEIEPRCAARVSELSLALSAPQWSHSDTHAWLAARLYHEFRQPDTASLLAMEGIALELLAQTSRQSARNRTAKPPRWLEEARELLAALFLQGITLSSVAESVDIHPVHLAREFRRHYRCTPGEYVRHLRVEFAARQMAVSEASLGEIALLAGFHDQSHFTRTFKSLVGLTPACYRAAFRA